MNQPVRLLVLALAIAQPVLGYLPNVTGLPTVAQRALELETVAQPAGYAFGIWGVIYLWSLVLAFSTWRRNLLTSTQARRVLPGVCVAFAANAAWVPYVCAYGLDLVSVLILAVGAAGAVRALYGLDGRDVSFWRLRGPLGLLAGWMCIALVPNVASALLGLGVGGLQGPPVTTAVVLIAIAGSLCAVLAWRLPASTFALAVIWGLLAIAVHNLIGSAVTRTVMVALPIAMAVLVLGGLLLGHVRPARPRQWQT